ncbi:hypothetical protein RFI_40042, partial [Reticulomyxa filosa]
IVNTITNKFIENNEKGNTEPITYKEKIEDIIRLAQKDATKRSNVVKNIQTEGDTCSSYVLDEFDERIEDASYPEDIKEEHKKMLERRIMSIREQGIEDWKYKSNAKETIGDHINRLNHWILPKNKTLPQGDAIEALTKEFSEQFKETQIALKKKLQESKKTPDQCITNTFEILSTICQGQKMTERLLDSKVLNEIYNSPNLRDLHIFEMNAKGNDQETILDTMKKLVIFDSELVRKKKADFEQMLKNTEKQKRTLAEQS